MLRKVVVCVSVQGVDELITRTQSLFAWVLSLSLTGSTLWTKRLWRGGCASDNCLTEGSMADQKSLKMRVLLE
jgi:hypothetical protein